MTVEPTDSRAALVRDIAATRSSRVDLWVTFLRRIQARRVAELGVYRGEFATQLLAGCPSIERYYMIDPWRHLDDWNKPANRDDETFERIFAEAMRRTQPHEQRRVVLRGRTAEVIDRIPDASLDFAYIDGDHTLRGITVDLIRAHDKLRPGGWIAGDDFSPSIWQHGTRYEPTLVFPFAVHFAEAVGARIYGLPQRQFLIEAHEAQSQDGFAFIDLTAKYHALDLLGQLSSDMPAAAEVVTTPAPEARPRPPPPATGAAPPRTLLTVNATPARTPQAVEAPAMRSRGGAGPTAIIGTGEATAADSRARFRPYASARVPVRGPAAPDEQHASRVPRPWLRNSSRNPSGRGLRGSGAR